MTRAWVSGATSTYQYDHTIARVAQITPTTTTHYPTKLYSVEYQGVSTTTGTSTAYIFHGDTLVAYIEQALADGVATGTPTTYYVHPDHLGSTNVVTDEEGDVVEALDYYPYGAERVHEGAADADRTFIGQFSNDATALSYLNARYYDPARGQFLSQDPVYLGNPRGQNLSNPQTLNSYGYANGNPITNKDPLGLWAISYNFASGSIEGRLGAGGAGSFNAGLTFVSGRDGGLEFTRSYGGTGTFGQRSTGYPSGPSNGVSNNGPFVIGTYAGAGCGAPQCGPALQFSGSYSQTVDSLSDLSGPANSINVNLEQGSFSMQTDEDGNNTYTLSYKGLGKGASVSSYQAQNSSNTLVSTRSVINTATNTYSSAQASYQSAVSSLQSRYHSLKAQVDKLTKDRSANTR